MYHCTTWLILITAFFLTKSFFPSSDLFLFFNFFFTRSLFPSSSTYTFPFPFTCLFLPFTRLFLLFTRLFLPFYTSFIPFLCLFLFFIYMYFPSLYMFFTFLPFLCSLSFSFSRSFHVNRWVLTQIKIFLFFFGNMVCTI